jgi:uncharacterized membrane protein YedE/YeeE
METRPPHKSFWMVPFTIHATLGLLRDQGSRRKMMMIFLIIALALVLAGFTVLSPWLEPHEHPWRFILYWLVCGWQTLLILLLALLDILVVRAQARATRKAFREQYSKEAGSETTSRDEE